MQPIAVSAAPHLPSALRRHSETTLRHLDEPLLGGNRLQLLQDGPETFSAMFEAIEQARDHINIESYIVEAQGPGEELARRLAARCRDGVRVNLLFDSVGSLGTAATYFEGLRRCGVTLAEYRPVSRWRTWFGRAAGGTRRHADPLLHQRNHRKLMVVDGRIGFIGGVNISQVYATGSAPAVGSGSAGTATPAWRDLHVRVEGPVVQRLQRLFIGHWQRHVDAALQAARYFPPLAAVGSQRAALAATEAGRRRNPYYGALIGAIEAARLSVQMTTAYLVPTRRLLRALVQAAQRGVRVELVVPGVSDAWLALAAGRSHYSELLRAGVQIHERHDRLLHAKACVIDGIWATIGSSNADWRSIVHNAEANLVVIDAAFGAQMQAAFAVDVAAGHRVELAVWRQRAASARVQEWLARRFEFFL